MKLLLRSSMTALLSTALIACNPAPEEPRNVAEAQTNASPTSAEAADSIQPEKTESATAKVASAANGSSSPAASAVPAAARTEPARKPVVPPEIINLPSGTTLMVLMIDAVGTDTSQIGDTFSASIREPVIVNGKTVIAKGTKVQGRVETLDEPGRVKGKAAISLVLTQLVRGDKIYRIVTEPFSAQAESGTKGDAVKVGGGAALGALVGAIAGGKKGAAVGAGVGAGAGTAAVLVTKGAKLRIEPETSVDFVLKEGIDIVMTKSTS